MENSYPKTLFSILHSGREECLLRTLASVYSQEYPHVAVLVADSGSSEGFGSVLKSRFPGLVYRKKNADTGIASGRNFCMDHYLSLGFEFIFMLDDDIELAPDCLARLMEVLTDDPSVGMAAPLLLNADGSVLSSGGFYLRLFGQPILRRDTPEKRRVMDFASGAIGLYRKSAIRDVGEFDAVFDPYGFEDIDYGLRLRAGGYGICLAPEARCRHISDYAFHRESRFHIRHTTAHRLFCACKHVPFPFFICAFLPWFLLRRAIFPILKFALRGQFQLASAVLRGMKSGVMEILRRGGKSFDNLIG